ncbi:hypothetical protein J1N35_004947 [Gossypium stocksii]|uniref:Uncharacterized protein n=1 Tax=Gossypium stocksii TaxID=47602 RepID=A0A9D4AGK5_9ROSI|nr:hypothetical protein J1N35_004947 [Gossypium stocksii]
MDWLFYSNNPLAPKIVAVNLPRDFKFPNDMFEGKRDPQAHLMQYNDYMNMMGALDLAKYKNFSMTLKEVRSTSTCPFLKAQFEVSPTWARFSWEDSGLTRRS